MKPFSKLFKINTVILSSTFLFSKPLQKIAEYSILVTNT